MSIQLSMSETRYASLARDLQASIIAGHLKPGSLLPGEIELAEAHGVSRGTVRAALDILARDGVVERRRGSGTRVMQPRAPAGFGQALCSIDELIHYAEHTRRVIDSQREIVVDVALAALLDVPPGSRWLHIRSLRIDDASPHRPICANDAYVAASLAGVVPHLTDERTALCNLLARHCGVRVDCLEQELQGQVIPAELAESLACQAGDAAMRILRRYRDASGWTFLATIGVHPADRFAYRMKLTRATTVA